jgi:hypothetical protein
MTAPTQNAAAAIAAAMLQKAHAATDAAKASAEKASENERKTAKGEHSPVEARFAIKDNLDETKKHQAEVAAALEAMNFVCANMQKDSSDWGKTNDIRSEIRVLNTEAQGFVDRANQIAVANEAL